MKITTEMVKELRDTTGVSVMQCKKALEESEGDMETALILLRKQSSASAAKKSDRTLGAGLINVKDSADKTAVTTIFRCFPSETPIVSVLGKRSLQLGTRSASLKTQ